MQPHAKMLSQKCFILENSQGRRRCRSKIDIITVIFFTTVLTWGGHYWWSLTGLPRTVPSPPLPIPINIRTNSQILLKVNRNLNPAILHLFLT